MISTFHSEALRKKFSQDLLELYREDRRRPIHGRELEEAEREERRRARSLWYVQVIMPSLYRMS